MSAASSVPSAGTNPLTEIRGLERALSVAGPDNGLVTSRIENLVRTTKDSGAASYGLRVLSMLGYREEELQEIAEAYNARHTHGGLDIHFFYIGSPGNLKRIDTGYRHN